MGFAPQEQEHPRGFDMDQLVLSRAIMDSPATAFGGDLHRLRVFHVAENQPLTLGKTPLCRGKHDASALLIGLTPSFPTPPHHSLAVCAHRAQHGATR